MRKFFQFLGIVLLTAGVSVGTTLYMQQRQSEQHQLVSYTTGEQGTVSFASHNRGAESVGVAPVDFTKAAEMSVGAVVHVKT